MTKDELFTHFIMVIGPPAGESVDDWVSMMWRTIGVQKQLGIPPERWVSMDDYEQWYVKHIHRGT